MQTEKLGAVQNCREILGRSLWTRALLVGLQESSLRLAHGYSSFSYKEEKHTPKTSKGMSTPFL